MYTIRNFIGAALFAAFAAILNYFLPEVKKEMEDSEDAPAYGHYIVLFYKGLFWATVAGSAGFILLPLLEVLLSALMDKVYQLWDKFGGIAIIVACAIGYYKFKKEEKQLENSARVSPSPSEADKVYYEEEAHTLHGDLTELVYNAVLDIAETTPIIRPRDTNAIDTTKIRQVGLMAVHQYMLDISTDQAVTEFVLNVIQNELNRHINVRSKNYKQLCPDSRPPEVFGVKNNGNFIIVEIVLYHDEYKDELKNRFKARYNRQQSMGNTYDRDF